MDITLLPRPERIAFAQRVNEHGMKWLHDRTVCICIKTADGNPIAHGSGVLFQVADVGFVLSAGHVLVNTEKNPDDTVMIAPDGGGQGLIPLKGVEIGRTADLAEADFGFARLPPPTMEYLSQHKRFARLAEVALEEFPTGECYSVLGYPREWAKLDPQTCTVSLKHLCFTTGLYRDEPTFSVGEESLVLTVGREMIPMDELASRLPELRGISGCGIWRMYGPESAPRIGSWNSDFIRLAGIEHSVVGTKAIKGVAIPYVLETLADVYPELRAPVDLAWQASKLDRQRRIVTPPRGSSR